MANRTTKISTHCFFFVALVFLLLACGRRGKGVSPKEHITIESISELYEHMHSNGVNTDTAMLYGYFFTDKNRNSLEKIADVLKESNFEFVKIWVEDTTQEYCLHMERIEVHTPQSLFSLHDSLYAIAAEYNVESYDGFDIGNADKSKPIARDDYKVPEEFRVKDSLLDGYLSLLVANAAFEHFPHKNEFCYFIRITTKYVFNDKSMLPTDSELDALDRFETFVENNLTQNGINHYYVFRDTYKGARNFYIAAKDKGSAMKVMTRIKNDGSQRNFDFEIISDPNWELYNKTMQRFR